MKKLFFSFTFLLFSFSLFAQQKQAALLPLTSNKEYTQQGKDDAEGIWGALSNAINSKGILSMVNRTDIEKLLSEKDFQTKSITEKVREAKRIANADYLIIGRLDELGGTYNLNVDIYDLGGITIATSFAGGIQKNNTYSFIQAAGAISESLFSIPQPRGNLSIAQKEKSVTIEWDRASDKNSSFSRKLEYKVLYSTRKKDFENAYFAELDAETGMEWKLNAKEAKFTVPDEDTTYYFTVLVRNPLGALAMYDVKSSSGKVVQNNQRANNDISVSDDFVFVEGGTFQMGSNDGQNNEKPVHTVTVSSFYMCEHEVTQEEWRAVMKSDPSYFKGDKRPVEQISWYQAIEYCNARSSAEKLTECYRSSGGVYYCDFSANGYRLPTEAEWEFAAKGGTKSSLEQPYSGSSTIDLVAWYDVNSGNTTYPVMTKKPNALGIYDMSGNVWEWCWDWKGSYSSGSQTDPVGASSGAGRVLRGGGWCGDASSCRVAGRNCDSPGYSNSGLGFRVVRSSSR